MSVSVTTGTSPKPQWIWAGNPPTDLLLMMVNLWSNRHREYLDSVVAASLAERNDFIGGNMFVYYSAQNSRDFRDQIFAVLDVDG